MPKDQIHHGRKEKHGGQQHGVNGFALGDQVHEKAGNQRCFYRRDEQSNGDRHGLAVEMHGPHPHRYDRANQQRDEHEPILLDVALQVVPIMSVGMRRRG